MGFLKSPHGFLTKRYIGRLKTWARGLYPHFTTTTTKAPLFVSKSLGTIKLYGKQSQEKRKGNILTILMKAGLFIKLAMSKLNPVPVCKTMILLFEMRIIENYSHHYNLIIINWEWQKISPSSVMNNLQDWIPLLTSVLLFSDLTYKNHFQGQDLMPFDSL